MPNFFNLYNSFDDFYASFFQGNEVEFLYNNARYSILPVYNELKNIVGVLIGKENDSNDSICMTKNELYHMKIEGRIFASILNEIVIIWNNL